MNPKTQQIHCGDNLSIMRTMSDESVDLIYLDPPFFSGKNYDVVWKDGTEVQSYKSKNQITGGSFKDNEWYHIECPKCNRKVVKAERFCPECGTDLQDITAKQHNDIYAYIDWMILRLKEMHRILKPTGSIYLHCDHHAVHYLKIEMDRIFGMNNFKTQITWKRCLPKGNAKTFANNSDYILYYVKSKNFTFNIQYNEYSPEMLKNFKYDDNDGRGLYQLQPVSAPNGKEYDLGYGEKMPKGGYRWLKETMIKKINDNRIIIKPGKTPRQKLYLLESKGVPHDNIWTDITNVLNPIYPTEKPEKLLNRIIKSSSNPGDIVFDPFCGCATTVLVAKNLNRQYIGIDISPKACDVIANRLGISPTSIISKPLNINDLRSLTHNEFQQWVCTRMSAKNTSPDPTRHGGADGGIDGIIKSNLLTNDYAGALIQVKQSENIGVDVIRKHFAVMDENNVTKGFVIALSFGKGAINKVNDYKKKGKVEIILVKAENITGGYF